MKLIRVIFLFLWMVNGFAADLNVVGQIQHTLTKPTVDQFRLRTAPTYQSSKQIALLKIKLSNHARAIFEKRTESVLDSQQTMPSLIDSEKKVQLGMGSVPVLDQGQHGTCVTFAITAALDAVLGKGDYISQLCSLQLGRYLERVSYGASGWNGTWGNAVLNQMAFFGIVSKKAQRANGCGGLTEYPGRGAEPTTEMSTEAYHELSEPMDESAIAWSSIIDMYEVLQDKTDMNATLQTVKATLNAGDRITFGVLLLDINRGVVGAVGRHRTANDTWVLTPEIAKNIYEETDFAGHEMIITGYDDDATAMDDHQRVHKGLLSLRNSWGPHVGDKGNFYMSYDYFKTLTTEAFRIRGLRLQPGQ